MLNCKPIARASMYQIIRKQDYASYRLCTQSRWAQIIPDLAVLHILAIAMRKRLSCAQLATLLHLPQHREV